MIIEPPLKRAFLRRCRLHGIDPVVALEQAISNWLSDDTDHVQQERARLGRPLSITRRKLSPELVQAARLRTADILQFSQRNLADAVGVHPAQLSKWLGGSAVPQKDEVNQSVAALCDLLGVPRDGAFVEHPVDAPEQVAA